MAQRESVMDVVNVLPLANLSPLFRSPMEREP